MRCLPCAGSHRHRQVHSICALDPRHAAEEVALKGEHPWRSLRKRVAEGGRLLIGVARGDETGRRPAANHLSSLVEQPGCAPHGDQGSRAHRHRRQRAARGSTKLLYSMIFLLDLLGSACSISRSPTRRNRSQNGQMRGTHRVNPSGCVFRNAMCVSSIYFFCRHKPFR